MALPVELVDRQADCWWDLGPFTDEELDRARQHCTLNRGDTVADTVWFHRMIRAHHRQSLALHAWQREHCLLDDDKRFYALYRDACARLRAEQDAADQAADGGDDLDDEQPVRLADRRRQDGHGGP